MTNSELNGPNNPLRQEQILQQQEERNRELNGGVTENGGEVPADDNLTDTDFDKMFEQNRREQGDGEVF
jgi:hypothetical protein